MSQSQYNEHGRRLKPMLGERNSCKNGGLTSSVLAMGDCDENSLLYRNVVLNLVITADFSEISRMRAQEITSRWV